MKTGIVKRVLKEKGFCFIRDPQTGIEYFCHRSAVRDGRFDDLEQETSVQFDVGEGPKGPRAENVRVG